MEIAKLLFAVLIITVLAIPATSVEVKSGDQVHIKQPKDDLIVSGGRVIVDAPVSGDLIVAGGEVEVLDKVAGDLIAAGGKVDLRGDVGGKLIVAGGSLRIEKNVGKFVIASGGEVVIGKNSRIDGDVFVAGGKIENAGIIEGNITVFGKTFENKGFVKGEQIFKETKILPPYFSEIFAFGFLLLGFLLVWFNSDWFERIDSEIGVRSVGLIKKTIFGFIAIIVSAIIVVLLFISVIGIPSALLILSAFTIAILLSNVFVSYTMGKVLLSRKKQNPYLYLVIGFVILFIAFRIPHVGDVIRIITTSLGFGGIIYVVRDWRRVYG
ncbi:bactofilin family protein [Archaeoglobus sulfaticallidus]|nr:polymer-forming cytoskeletal protein [Archaeoglobus sulfaticallidus]